MTEELNESVGDRALLSLQCDLEMMERVVHDEEQCPPVFCWLHVLHVLTNDGSSLANGFIDTSGIFGTDAPLPGDHSTVDDSCHHRLIEDLLQFELPQKIESVHPFLVHSVRVSSPVQSVIQYVMLVQLVWRHWGQMGWVFLGTSTKIRTGVLSCFILKLNICCWILDSGETQDFGTLGLTWTGPAPLPWLSLSNCLLTWSVITVIACISMVHHGHLSRGWCLLECLSVNPYTPSVSHSDCAVSL